MTLLTITPYEWGFIGIIKFVFLLSADIVTLSSFYNKYEKEDYIKTKYKYILHQYYQNLEQLIQCIHLVKSIQSKQNIHRKTFLSLCSFYLSIHNTFRDKYYISFFTYI